MPAPFSPPLPKRPLPSPQKIPPVKEVVVKKSYPVNPFQGIRIEPDTKPDAAADKSSKRRPTPSELDFDVVRHDVQIKGLERRLDDVEDVTVSMDAKLDNISEILTQEINDRKLEKASKEEEKANADHKTKRYQAFLAAIPLIMAPVIGLVTAYISKEPPSTKSDIVKVVVSEYTEAAEECRKSSDSKSVYQECIRKAQLENTPAFGK